MEAHKHNQNCLAVYRRRMGFTQKQVAQLLGHRGVSMISHYEHGRSLPPLPIALSLEIILRIPVAFLFPGIYDDIKRRIRQQEEGLAGAGQKSLFGTIRSPHL